MCWMVNLIGSSRRPATPTRSRRTDESAKNSQGTRRTRSSWRSGPSPTTPCRGPGTSSWNATARCAGSRDYYRRGKLKCTWAPSGWSSRGTSRPMRLEGNRRASAEASRRSTRPTAGTRWYADGAELNFRAPHAVGASARWRFGRPTPSTRRFSRGRVASMAWRVTEVSRNAGRRREFFHHGPQEFADVPQALQPELFARPVRPVGV